MLASYRNSRRRPLLPVSMAAILNFDSEIMSSNVCSDMFKWGMVNYVGITIEIATASLAVQKLFPLPVSLAVILNFDSLLSSTNDDQRRPTCQVKVGHCRKIGGSFWNCVAISYRLSYFQFRFGGRHLESVVNKRRETSTVSYSGQRWSKIWGSRWNYVSMSLETEVISTSRKYPICPWRAPLVFQISPCRLLERATFTW